MALTSARVAMTCHGVNCMFSEDYVAHVNPKSNEDLTLRHPEVLERPKSLEGVLTFDLAQDGRE